MNSLRSSIFAATALGSLSLAAFGQADIAYEGFDYTTGLSLSGLNGGTGFTSAWSLTGGGTAVVSGSLAGSQAAGNSATVTPTSGTVYAVRSLPVLNTGTVYLGFLIDNLNDGTRFLAVPLWLNSTEVIYLGQSSAGTTWNINKGAGALGTGAGAASSVSTNSNEPVRLVLRIDFDAGGANATSGGTSDLLRLYVNPATSQPEPGAASASISTWDLGGGINQLRLGAGFNNGAQTTAVGGFDEIRIGTTWECGRGARASGLSGAAGWSGHAPESSSAACRCEVNFSL